MECKGKQMDFRVGDTLHSSRERIQRVVTSVENDGRVYYTYDDLLYPNIHTWHTSVHSARSLIADGTWIHGSIPNSIRLPDGI